MKWLLNLVFFSLVASAIAHVPPPEFVFTISSAAADRFVCTYDQTGTNVFQYYHPDHLTSTTVQTDAGGNRVQHYEYSAFGRTRFTESTTAFPVSRRYTCQVLDEDTGLYYYNFRYYDPQLARFIQPDDIIPDLGNPQSYNRYSYVLNNPLRYTDPDGHGPIDDALFNTETIKSSYQLIVMRDSLGWKIVEVPVGVAGIAVGVVDAGFNIASFGGKGAVAGTVKTGVKAGLEAGAKMTVKEAAEGVAKVSAKEAPVVLKNAEKGRVFEKQVEAELKTTRETIAPQITLETHGGTRTRIDFVTTDKSGQIGLTEAKSSETARLTPNQKKAFPEIEKTGATVKGEGKPGLPGGTQIPPTRIDIVRPNLVPSPTPQF